MAEDVGDKTEPPTPRRRSEARGAGQVARSQDLAAAVLLLAALMALLLFGQRIWQTMTMVMRAALGGEDPPTMQTALNFGSTALWETGMAVAPLLVMMFLIALMVMYAQVGRLFTWKPLTPNLGKLNPINGAKRVFSMYTLVQLLQSLVKLALVGGVAWLCVQAIVNKVMLVHTVDFESVFHMIADLVFYVGIRLAVVLVLLAILDYFYQRHRHEKQLKMTKEEVKEEMRRMEGDPVVKRRRREVQLRLTAERIKSAVPKADVVVTNPTHYAVALRYAQEEMAAPKVIAKGVDYLAQRIREVAAASAVPIVQKPELARMLYDDVAVGQEVPERLYRAVAEVLAYVYELAGRKVVPRGADGIMERFTKFTS